MVTGHVHGVPEEQGVPPMLTLEITAASAGVVVDVVVVVVVVLLEVTDTVAEMLRL